MEMGLLTKLLLVLEKMFGPSSILMSSVYVSILFLFSCLRFNLLVKAMDTHLSRWPVNLTLKCQEKNASENVIC